jgi:glycosyltransferase involved in cell wall biosynthesis
MRIAIIAPPWLPVPPPAYGGTEAVLDSLARGLSDAGHDVLLYATGDSTCPVPKKWTFAQAPGIAVGGVPIELRQVIDAYDAARGDFDVVHDHTITGPFVAQGYPDLPVVTTNHGPFDEGLTAIYRAMADRVPIIAISHHQASTAADIPIAAVIHHGIDIARFPFGSGDGGYAAFLGRMNPDKGVDTAIRVARKTGIPLRIAAKMREQAERDYFRNRVKPLLGDDIEYIGEVGGGDKLEFLARARCLLNPINWPEPFGMVMIEALACGTPVVTRPCGAAPEIVEDGVTGFVRTEEDGLATAVVRAAELDRSACRQSVEDRFSTRRLAQDHIDLYTRVSDAWPDLSRIAPAASPSQQHAAA